MIVESFGNKGLAAILPLSVIEELGEQGENIHMHTLSHAPKHESMKGRNVGDLGTCGEGTPLNSEETKVMEDDKCGKHHQRGLARHNVDGAHDLRGTGALYGVGGHSYQLAGVRVYRSRMIVALR